jgi:uncharacterized protein YbjT (DUF2867 family)
MKTALLAGATGLIGSQLLELLINNDRYGKIIAISRKPLELAHPKVQNVITDFSSLELHKEQFRANDIFCCLGTTMRQAKTREAFRQVDLEYPVSLAKIGFELGAQCYLMVSALGANKNSSVFYNRVKGETEEIVLNIGFERVHILRPSLLLGPRKEQRTGENTAKQAYRIFGFLIPKKYKAVESSGVARAMVQFAGTGTRGNFIHESVELQNF